MSGRPPITKAPESGERLAALRKSAGLTQVQLAEMVGIPARSISFMSEKHKAFPHNLS